MYIINLTDENERIIDIDQLRTAYVGPYRFY